MIFSAAQLIREISTTYEIIKEDYIPFINTSKQTTHIGGTYYGRTELLSTVGTHFEKTVGYNHYGSYGFHSYYDFAFKVGGAHYHEFKAIKENFFNDFQKRFDSILTKHGFENNKRQFSNREYQIRLCKEVTHGTNFSVYLGLQIKIKENDNPNELRLKKEWIYDIL